MPESNLSSQNQVSGASPSSQSRVRVIQHCFELTHVLVGSSQSRVTRTIESTGGGNSSVVKCPPLNWRVGCSIHGHWVNCRSAALARAFTPIAPARSTIQASACRQFPPPKLKQQTNKNCRVIVEVCKLSRFANSIQCRAKWNLNGSDETESYFYSQSRLRATNLRVRVIQIFQVESEGVARTVESLWVIGLQGRVKWNLPFFLRFFAAKWHPTS